MRAACTSLLIVASLAGASRAQSGPDRAAADELFRQGLAYAKQHRYSEACPKFEASHRLDPSYGALLNLGNCYQQVGRTASAWGAFREAADLARKYAEERRVRVAEARAAALEPQLARLELVIKADDDVRGYEVRRDGQPIDKALLGTPMPIDPGEYEIDAGGPGLDAWHGRVRVAQPGAHVTEQITLRRAAAPPEPPPAAPEPVEATVVVAPAPAVEPPRFVITLASALGYASGSLDAATMSASGMAVQANVRGGVAFGKLLVLGGLSVDIISNPSLTIGSLSGSASMTVSQLSLGSGVGYRVTPDVSLGALARLSKVSLSGTGLSLSSSFGPGAEIYAQWDALHTGRWSLGVCASVTVATMDISGASWTSRTVGAGVTATYF